MSHLQVLSPQQISFLQIEAARANPPIQLIESKAAFSSQPIGFAMHQYQEHTQTSSALQQIRQYDTSFTQNRNTGSLKTGTGNVDCFMPSTQSQFEYNRSTIANQDSHSNRNGVDHSAAIAHLQNYITNYGHALVASPIVEKALQSAAHGHFPFCLAHADDKYNLSSHQQFLRLHIQAFKADDEDVLTYVRGRNRPILLGQIGIRCRHCAHVKVSLREKGSTYYPANIMGIYQAAQNMSATHIQCGRCPPMPNAIKEHFKCLIATKSSSNGAGRTYWAEKVREMGLIDTEHGIFSIM